MEYKLERMLEMYLELINIVNRLVNKTPSLSEDERIGLLQRLEDMKEKHDVIKNAET